MKVIILGAGVGALSCATFLSEHKDIKITILDRNNQIGGLARTNVRAIDGQHSEICWKAISIGYVTFLKLMNTITSNNGVKLITHLKPLEHFIYAFKDKIVVEKNNSFLTCLGSLESGFKKLYGRSLSFSDRLFIRKVIILSAFCSDNDIMKYDEILWCQYARGISPELRLWLVDSTSIYLGMQYDRVSVAFILLLMRKRKDSPLLNDDHVFYSFDGPMNDVLFNPWKQYLTNRGVKFLLGSNITSINVKSNCIDHITFDSLGIIKTIKGDIYINSLDCCGLAALLPRFTELSLCGKQLQTQVLYFLDRSITYTSGMIVIFPDSPWFLMARLESSLWDLYAEYISVGIGIWNVPGNNGKMAIECTIEEIAQECWNQIINSQTNLKLPNKMPKYNIWDSFQYDEKTQCITSIDLKFSNNVGTMKLRPKIKDSEIENLYHANAYTRTNINVYNMESAAEAGMKCAEEIIKKVN